MILYLLFQLFDNFFQFLLIQFNLVFSIILAIP